MNNVAIITAAGSGSRCGLNYNKLLYKVGDMYLIEKTVAAFLRKDIEKIIITASSEDLTTFKNIFKDYSFDIQVILGGKTRQESVFYALQEIKDANLVLIHDGARAFVSQKIIDDALCVANKYGNACACCESIDSLRVKVEDSTKAVDRSLYMRVQTPQVFNYKSIYNYHAQARDLNLEFSDDASLFEYFNNEIHISLGDEKNIKITTKKDLELFCPNNAFCGVGWDTHMLCENRKLILGGIEINHTKGLLGHSDADVLIHAIMDALLSASHNKDIGQLFPDNAQEYKDISSLILLKKVATLLKEGGFIIGNISATILAQKPKLATYIPLMQNCIAETLAVEEEKITISATTTEKLGLCGREEAISANAYCLLYKA